MESKLIEPFWTHEKSFLGFGLLFFGWTKMTWGRLEWNFENGHFLSYYDCLWLDFIQLQNFSICWQSFWVNVHNTQKSSQKLRVFFSLIKCQYKRHGFNAEGRNKKKQVFHGLCTATGSAPHSISSSFLFPLPREYMIN
jgi:hypothetical protein